MKFTCEKDFDDFNSADEEPITKSQEEFANELFDFLQELIDIEEQLTEEFVSKSTLNTHFYKHSLAGRDNKISSQQDIWYDFKYVNEYKKYEDVISQQVIKTKYMIPSLLDNKLIERYMHKLFEGGKSVLFTTMCGFTNKTGNVMIGIYAYSTDVTTNYKTANTVTLVILTPTGKTISMYPVDATYLETKLNNIIKKHSNVETKLSFNR